MSDHPELENSVAAFVLGAAEEDEMEEVRLHVAGCAECRFLAARLQRAADSLPLAAELVEPPARLRSRILEAAAASARAPIRSPGRARIISLPRRGARRWSPGFRVMPGLSTAAVAALALAVLGLGSWNLYLANQLSNQQGQVASETLTGHGAMSGVQATVHDFRGQSLALVSFNQMPAPPIGKVYQLWLIPASGAPESVLVFVPEIDGSKTVVINRVLANYKLIAVTVENGPSGASAPTQDPGIAGNTV